MPEPDWNAYELPETLFILSSELPGSRRDSAAENYLLKGKYMEDSNV